MQVSLKNRIASREWHVYGTTLWKDLIKSICGEGNRSKYSDRFLLASKQTNTSLRKIP